MARIALMVAGFIVGAFFGAPFLGMAIGGMLGSVLFPPNLGNQEGPRLNDLRVSTSTNGAPIAFGYNRYRLGANIIWSPGLVEHKTVEKHSAKGGPTYTTTTYTYTASFAAAFGEGPDNVYRIWGDSKLIYGSAIYTEPNAECFQVEPLTLYAFSGDGTGVFSRTSVGSPALTRAGLIGLMFNTHPKELLPGDPHDSADESFPPVHHPVTTYGTYGGDEPLTGCPTPSFDVIITGKFIVSIPGNYTLKAFADDGYFIGIQGATFVSGPKVGCPGTTPKMGYSVTWGSNQPQSYRDTGIHGDPAVVNFPAAGEYPFEICWTENGGGQNQFSLVLGNVGDAAAPDTNPDVLSNYAVIKPATPKFQWDAYTLYAGNIPPNSHYSALVGSGWPSLAASDYVTAEQTNPGVPYHQKVEWYFTDGAYNKIGASFFTWTNEGAVSATIPPGAVYLAAFPDIGYTLTAIGATRYTYQQHGYQTPPTVSPTQPKYPAPTIYPGDELQMPDPTIQANEGAANVSAHRGMCYAVWEDFPLADFGNRIPNIRGEIEFLLYDPDASAALSAANIADQVEDLCIRAGIAAADIDVFQLSGTCAGYMIGRPASARNCLQPLAQGLFFDACESDGKLKFVPRGGSAVMTIPEDDLGLEADKGKITEQIGQEQDLPRDVTVLFSDPALDYQRNKSLKSRSARVVKTANQVVIELPMVMDPVMARQIAERALYLAYSERKPYDMNLWKATYMQLDPTDVVNFVYEGMTFEMRIVKGSIGAGFAVALSGVSEDARNYLSSAAGASPVGYIPAAVGAAARTILWLFDLPLLRDSDAVAGSSGYYFAMGSAQTGWPGAVLYKSSDNVAFSFEGSSASPVSFGVATNALGAPRSPWTWDDDNSVNVVMTDGTLAGTTDLNVLNGANALIVGDEVIQFGVCVQEADGSYTLSHLLRGRRGTEWACDGHVVGETVIDPFTGLERVEMPISLISQDRYYRAVTAGQNIADVASQDVAIEGDDLKPYAPVHVTGARVSNDLTISWVRRTRLAGDWRDGTGDVPLSEDQEMYEVDILDSWGNVIRTFKNLINPEVLYLASDQTTDFGAAQAAVSVAVYQVSGQVGRGFPGEATV